MMNKKPEQLLRSVAIRAACTAVWLDQIAPQVALDPMLEFQLQNLQAGLAQLGHLSAADLDGVTCIGAGEAMLDLIAGCLQVPDDAGSVGSPRRPRACRLRELLDDLSVQTAAGRTICSATLLATCSELSGLITDAHERMTL